MSDNPFSEPEDSDRTVLRGPGQARPQPAPTPQFGAGMGGPPPMAGTTPPPPPSAPAPRLAGEAEGIPKVGPGPLAAAAWPLLDVLGRLSTAGVAAQPNPVELRERLMRAFRAFEQDASQLGLQPDEIRAAHYALCASLDDVVLSTPWGAQSDWGARSLVSTFHQEVRSGDRFFDLLTGMQRDPGRYRGALEVCHLCLSLGMQGRYRLAPRGAADLDRIREGLYQLLQQLRGNFERDLSPRWRGVDAPHRPPRGQAPAWLAAVAALLLLGGGWSYLNAGAQAQADALSERLSALPPGTMPEIVRAAPPVPPAPPPPPPPAPAGAPPPRPDVVQVLRQFLQPEIAAGLVEVSGDAQRMLVRIKGTGMFASASATLEPRFRSLMERIGEALRDEPGRVLVLGYSDNVPIRTARFPSNTALSLARAESVLDLIARAEGRNRARFTAEGRGEQDPIGDNRTPEGREANRRIEVVLLRGVN